MPWSGDVVALEILLDGRPVLLVDSRRRFGAVEKPLQLSCAAGKHVLVVRIDGWSGDPRFAIGLPAECQTVVVDAGQPVSMRVKAQRRKGVVTFDAKPSAPVHWLPEFGGDPVELRDGAGHTYKVKWSWSDGGALLVTPAPGAPRKQELRLVWSGLRDLSGRPLKVEPSVVKLQ